MNKKAKTTYTTAVGVADYPYLFKPDTKFKADGEYSVKLTLSKDDAKEHVDRYEKIMSEHMNEKGTDKRSPYNQYKKVDGGYEFKFKMNAKIKGKNGSDYEQRPKIYDADANLITKELACYSGSKMKIAYQIYPYFNNMLGAGLSLMLSSAQITELVTTAPEGKGKSSPFKKEKGSFKADEVEANTEKETASSDANTSENEDDF